LVLESNLWLVHWSLSCHQLLGSGITVAWIFSWSSAMALCLSACCCVMKHLKCLHEFCIEIYPATDWVRRQQRVSIQYWSFASNDEGFS
jgi:hypothetical protein